MYTHDNTRIIIDIHNVYKPKLIEGCFAMIYTDNT